MTKAINVKDEHRKTTKSKVKEAPRVGEKALGAETEYIVDSFYDLRPVLEAQCVLFLGIDLFVFYFLPGARYPTSVGAVTWFTIFLMSKHVGRRYKGTKHGEYGKNLFMGTNYAICLIHELLQYRGGSLASTEEGRSAAHAFSMVVLAKYFLCQLVFQISSNPRSKIWQWPQFVAYPFIILKQPRFGVVQPEYEALAFFVALSSGWLVGVVIDNMRWRNYLNAFRTERELKKTS